MRKTPLTRDPLPRMFAFVHLDLSEWSRGNSSVGRAQPCQGWGREFESRFPLDDASRHFLFMLHALPSHSPLMARHFFMQ